VVVAEDVTRAIMQNGKRVSGVLDEAAVEVQVSRNLGRLETVKPDEQSELLSQACTALGLYKVSTSKSLDDAVDEVVGMSPSAAARRDAVLDLADELVAWNQSPTVAGGMSITATRCAYSAELAEGQILISQRSIPRSVRFGLYTGSPASRAFGKRAVTAVSATDASSRASGAPRQKCGPLPKPK
jgi:hypothetical protein